MRADSIVEYGQLLLVCRGGYRVIGSVIRNSAMKLHDCVVVEVVCFVRQLQMAGRVLATNRLRFSPPSLNFTLQRA